MVITLSCVVTQKTEELISSAAETLDGANEVLSAVCNERFVIDITERNHHVLTVTMGTK
jgi:hypothetical protein